MYRSRHLVTDTFTASFRDCVCHVVCFVYSPTQLIASRTYGRLSRVTFGYRVTVFLKERQCILYGSTGVQVPPHTVQVQVCRDTSCLRGRTLKPPSSNFQPLLYAYSYTYVMYLTKYPNGIPKVQWSGYSVVEEHAP